MIVLDSSALVAIIKPEEEAEQLLEILTAEECAIGAPTLVEARAWCASNLTGGTSLWLEDLMGDSGIPVIPFGREMADVASQAFVTFGRATGHPARLNFGDCMAYAVSVVLRAPLLFKGSDFGRTDVLVHPRSVRTDIDAGPRL